MRTRLLFFSLLIGIGSTHAQVPRLVSYQGMYTDTLGIPKPDSTYSMTFRLYSTSTGGFPLWAETKSLQVKKGLFYTNLGDVNPLTLQFDVPYWLGVLVGSNPELLPRTQLTSAGYSLHAAKADTAAYAGGASLTLPFVDTVSVSPEAFYIMNTGTGRAGRFRINNTNSIANALLVETNGFFNSLSSTINNTSSTASAVYGQVNGTGTGIYGNATGDGTGARGHTSGNGNGVHGSASSTNGNAGFFETTNPASNVPAVIINAEGSGAALSVGATGTGHGISVIVGNSTASAVVGTIAGSGFGVRGLSAGTGGGVWGDVLNGSLPAIYGTAAGTGHAVQGTSSGTGSAGRFIVSNAGNSADAVFVQTNGTGNALECRITNSSSSSPAVFGTTSGLGRAGTFTLTNLSNGNAGLYASTLGTGPAAYFEITNASNASPALVVSTIGSGLAADFNGQVSVTTLQIEGGSDLAEPFETTGESEIEPGSVMVIDASNPGKLVQSSSAYDSKVAGIASGAGGVTPGLTLYQAGVLEGKTTVAIAGRVYCKADASTTPIAPGDLLTTSPFSGHAMKAVDRERANGAIIGKAMTSLESGQGLILVLVNLQ